MLLYNKELNLYIKNFNNKCRTELMISITNLANNLLQQLPFKFKVIKNIIQIVFNKNLQYLNSELSELNYDRKSMTRIKKIKEDNMNQKYLLIKNNLEGIRNMNNILDDIKKDFMVDRQLDSSYPSPSKLAPLPKGPLREKGRSGGGWGIK
jgi:hypothetical protein